MYTCIHSGVRSACVRRDHRFHGSSNNPQIVANTACTWRVQTDMMGGMDPAGAPMYFLNNTCVARSTLYSSCSTAKDGRGQVLRNNKFYIDNPSYTGGDEVPGFPCSNGSWSEWLATGEDAGSMVSGEVPSVEEMVMWGRQLLGF